jgi:hypothetical protein
MGVQRPERIARRNAGTCLQAGLRARERGSPVCRLPALMRSGYVTDLCSPTVAGAAPALSFDAPASRVSSARMTPQGDTQFRDTVYSSQATAYLEWTRSCSDCFESAFVFDAIESLLHKSRGLFFTAVEIFWINDLNHHLVTVIDEI